MIPNPNKKYYIPYFVAYTALEQKPLDMIPELCELSAQWHQ